MNKAPWKDYEGNDLFEGDRIRHPSGEVGVIVCIAEHVDPNDRWRVDYGPQGISRLCLQVGWKGMAVKV